MPDTLWVESARNVVTNPALRAGVAGTNSNGPVTVTTVDGKKWASTTGTYVQMTGPGLPNQHYAASLRVGGTPGTEFTLDTSDYTVGAYADPIGGVIPASGSVRLDLVSRVPTAPGCSMVVVTLYLVAGSPLRITEGMITPVAEPGRRTGPYFDGDTPDGITDPTVLRTNLAPAAWGRSGFSANDVYWVVTPNQSISDHPAGIPTAARVVVGNALAAPYLASHYNVDGLVNSPVVRGNGAWIKPPRDVNVTIFNNMNDPGSRRTTFAPAEVWTYCTTAAPGYGYCILYAVPVDAAPVAVGETTWLTGAISEAGAVPNVYFDGGSPDTDTLDYAWVGVEGNSESTQTQVLRGDYRYDWTGTPNASPSTLFVPMWVQPGGEVEPEWPGLMGPYPLWDSRHYFDLPDNSPFIHSGQDPADAPAIMLIQSMVGTEPDGVYGPETASGVRAWRLEYGEDDETWVDDHLWWRMDTAVVEAGV